MDPRRLYAEMAELDKQLRALLRANPLNAQDANALRSRLMEKAAAIAEANPAFAASKEIEQVLWKPCFYKRIEDFRRRIRKYASAPAADRSIREHFSRVSGEFQQFLTRSSAFYEHLRDCFAKWLQANRRSRLPTASGGALPDALATNVSRCRHSLHRCFVFLGDLARYRELHSQKAKKNFAAAESFYHKALEVIPENGNPHNQLAVLATYVEAETVAVYRYCRSLLIAQPFTTAEENLALLFERSRQRPLAAPSTASASLTSSSPPKDKSSFLKSFLHRLTRMHGILFSMATRPGNSAANGNGSASRFGAAAASRSGDVVYPRDMELLLFKDLAVLMRAGVMGDALLLKVVVTNMFCAVRSLPANRQALDDAMRLSVLTATSVLEFLSEDIAAKHQQRLRMGSSSPEKLAPGMRLLGPVSVLCDFLRYNPEYLDVIAKTYAFEKANNASETGGEDSSSSVGPFAAKFLEALATLLNHPSVKQLYGPLVSGMTDSNQQLDLLREQQLLLKENIELQGFSPLSSLLDGASKWSDGGPTPRAALPEADAVKIRAWNLFHFARLLCGEGRTGEPLLFVAANGDFVLSSSPVAAAPAPTALPVPSGLSSQSVDGSLPSFSLGMFGRGQSTTRQPQHADEDEDDDFDDEVIVFQPSPGLTAMSREGPVGGHGGNSHKSSLSPAFESLPGGEPFSLRAPSPPVSETSNGQSSMSSRFGTNGSAPIGSSLGYPSFHSFGDFSGFSGQGLLSGWGRGSDAGSSSSASAATTLGMGSMRFPLDQGSGLFPPMGDLAAVERASAQYQREESSLSSFLAPPTSRLSTGSIGGFSTSSLSPEAPRAASRPPPGFSGLTPFGSQETDDLGGFEELSARAQPFYTRNPFINP